MVLGDDNEKQQLLEFLDEVDAFAEKLESHPLLKVYFIGTTDQLRNSTTAARTQIGRISNFGLLEMTRQRLREGSIRWETQLSLASFSQKILKKIQHLAFTDKVKIVNSYVPEKVKSYIEKNLIDELKYFQKKYTFEIKILSNDNFIIPEYKIDLLNKTKKLINTVENIDTSFEIKKINKNIGKKKVEKTDEKVKTRSKIKKTKSKKIKRTLWVRRKKKLN